MDLPRLRLRSNAMSKPIILTFKSWDTIRKALADDYPSSVLLIRNRMKEVLGFTVREYQAWREDGSSWGRVSDIRLDFYDEPKRTMFLLKYSDIIGKTSLDNKVE